MKKILIIIFSIILLLTVVYKNNIFKDVKVFFLDKFNYVYKTVGKTKNLLQTKEYLLKIIDEYEEKIESYESLIASYNLLEKENNELRTILEMPNNSYSIVYADIVEKSELYNYIIINRGKNKGIKEGNAVISTGGFIGIVKEVTNNSSTIYLINNMKYPVMVDSTLEYGQIDKYENGYYYVSGIKDDINIGDHIVTGKYSLDIPSGLLIGTIENINYDNFELSKILKVKCCYDYNELDIIGVIIK